MKIEMNSIHVLSYIAGWPTGKQLLTVANSNIAASCLDSCNAEPAVYVEPAAGWYCSASRCHAAPEAPSLQRASTQDAMCRSALELACAAMCLSVPRTGGS
mmetsp:Transcript_16481/g.35626  ORF Transcript_16481/g.35626 Transcript_16481/m.35626 type:complete len:101 (-) Transcript_16481:50-352(-)